MSCYQQSIRNIVSVAHQISIRWALSPFATKKRFLVIGIAAGNFTILDNSIQPLLNANLPEDPDKSIAIPVSIARKPAMDMFYAMRFLKETIPVKTQVKELGKALLTIQMLETAIDGLVKSQFGMAK